MTETRTPTLTATTFVARADAILPEKVVLDEMISDVLTNWKGTRVSKADTGTAKNYLNSQEIDTLNRITVMFLDQAEFRAQRRQTIQMADWGGFLDKFLADVELPVLQGAGSTRRQQALKLAHQQYDQFAEKRRLEAEQQAEQNYVNELQATAKTLARQRGKKGAK